MSLITKESVVSKTLHMKNRFGKFIICKIKILLRVCYDLHNMYK